MKTHAAVAFAAIVAIAGCQRSVTAPGADGVTPQSSGAGVTAAQINLDVILTGHGGGHVAFRQYHDGAQLVNLGVAVQHLAPHSSYVLQRAVDTLDGICTSTAWLTLGKGTAAATIDTDAAGSGHADLFRSLSAFPVGTTFDIRFRVMDAGMTNVVLNSDCYQFVIR